MQDDNNPPGNTGFPSRRDADFPERYVADDEISLYDLWNVLERRWYVIVGVFALVVVLAFIYVLNREPAYNYRTGVEIGTIDADGQLVESPRETRNQLRDFIIPSVRVEASEQTENVPDVELGGGDESRLMVLTSNGAAGRNEAIRDLHQEIVNQLLTLHREKTNYGLRELERRLDQERDQRARVQAELDRLERRGETLEERLSATRELRDELRSLNERMIADADSSPLLSMALGTQELSRLQERLDELEDQYRFELDRDRDQLESQLGQSDREIERIEDDIANVSPTSARFVATRSLEQAGTGNTLILALAIVLGGMLGLFSAFFWEFIVNARQRRNGG